MPKETYQQLLEQRNHLREIVADLRRQCTAALKESREMGAARASQRKDKKNGDAETTGVLLRLPEDWLDAIDEIVENKEVPSRAELLRRWVATGIKRTTPETELSDPPGPGRRWS